MCVCVCVCVREWEISKKKDEDPNYRYERIVLINGIFYARKIALRMLPGDGVGLKRPRKEKKKREKRTA